MRRQRTEAVRRRELAWVLAGFVLVEVGLAVGVDRYWRGVRDPEFAVATGLLAARQAEAPGRPLVLALGSSRTEMGLCASLLSAGPADSTPLVFNFGIAGGGPMMEQVCLRRLLELAVRPRVVRLEL